jgi:single-stranded-DNA-specific exonuclease
VAGRAVGGELALGIERSLSGRRWLWRQGEDRVAQGIAQRLRLPDLLGRLLAARGADHDTAVHFLEPTLRTLLPDPSTLQDMDAAVDRLARAVRCGETVGVFGDYDVDGACASAVLALVLGGLGCPVLTHIPDRLLEGYGPNAPALRSLVERGAGLVVCADCGTAAADALAAIAGVADVLVLDHHKAECVPPVLATVNPNRLDCTSGLGHVCATAVAFLTAVGLVRALRRAGHFQGRPEPDLRELLDLVALATVCDVMPLVGVNRALVTQGLRVMGRRGRPGLAALLDAAGVRDAPSAMSCGFALGPRINAGGRIGEAAMGLRLLLCTDPVEARALAAKLDAVNRERQGVEQGILDEAYAAAAAQAEAGHAALLVHGAGWHPGVVGIVAGRLRERQNRPALAGALADGIVKGSGRSVPGVDLGAAVIAARQAGLLLTGGGHAMAAGFSLPVERVAEFHALLDERLAAARDLPRAADLPVEASVTVPAATVELAEQLARLQPFGPGNEEPVLAVPRVRVVRGERIGRDGNTVRAWVQGAAVPRRGGSARRRAAPARRADAPGRLPARGVLERRGLREHRRLRRGPCLRHDGRPTRPRARPDPPPLARARAPARPARPSRAAARTPRP